MTYKELLKLDGMKEQFHPDDYEAILEADEDDTLEYLRHDLVVKLLEMGFDLT